MIAMPSIYWILFHLFSGSSTLSLLLSKPKPNGFAAKGIKCWLLVDIISIAKCHL